MWTRMASNLWLLPAFLLLCGTVTPARVQAEDLSRLQCGKTHGTSNDVCDETILELLSGKPGFSASTKYSP